MVLAATYTPSVIGSRTTRASHSAPPDSTTPVSVAWRRYAPAIDDRYIIQDREAVFAFLEDNQDIALLLVEAYRWLEEFFGTGIQVELRVTTDPEAEEATKQLFGYIRTLLPVKDALATLNGFDEDWFLDVLDRADGKLNFDLRFL